MKKLLGFISVAIIVMMAACGKQGGPGAIVEDAVNNMINGKYEAFLDACNCGEDSLPAEQVKQGKDMAISILKKTIDGVKQGQDEEAKKKLPASCKVLDEKVDGDEAVVELEITSVGGEASNSKVFLKKNKAGEWKIENSNDIMPSAPAPDLSGLDEGEDAEAEEAPAAEEEAEEAPAEEAAE